MSAVSDEIRKEVFGNGLVLITEPMRTLRSVALGVWMKREIGRASCRERV